MAVCLLFRTVLLLTLVMNNQSTMSDLKSMMCTVEITYSVSQLPVYKLKQIDNVKLLLISVS